MELERTIVALPAPRHRRLRLPRWVLLSLAIVGISFTSAAWANSSPVGASPDEGAHILYSWGVITGQVLPWNASEWNGEKGAKWVEVEYPSALDDRPTETCYMFNPSQVPCALTITEKSAIDAGTEVPHSDTAHGSSYMSRYPPLYYLFTGTTTWVGLAIGFNGVQTLLIARFVSGLLSLGMIAWSVTLLSRRFSPAVSVMAAALTLTPQFLSLAAAVNPNGFEIAAALALASAVILVRSELEESTKATHHTQVFLLISSLSLAFARPASIAWACLLWLLLLLPLRRTKRPALLSLGLAPTLATFAIASAAIAWFVYANLSRKGGVADQDLSSWEARSPQLRLLLVFLHFGKMIEDGFSVLGWGDTPLPRLAFVVWLALSLFVFGQLLLRVQHSALRPRFAVAFLGAGAAIIAVQSYSAAFAWQGRYLLPVLAATTVLLVPGMSASAADGKARSRLAVATVTIMTIISFSCLVVNLFRYAFGFSSMPSRFDDLPTPTKIGAWIPAGGLDAVGIAGATGAGLLALTGLLLLLDERLSVDSRPRSGGTCIAVPKARPELESGAVNPKNADSPDLHDSAK